jgi:hypothetical protein
MRVVTQIERHNAKQVQVALKEGKKEHDKSHPSIHQAAVIAGEFIAAKNRNGSVRLKEVIKSYKPDYLQKRGVV